MAEKKPEPLGLYMVRRVGLRRSMSVCTFVVAWGIYMEKGPKGERREHTMDGYTKYWRQSLAKTYRERDLFQIVFPGQNDPTELWGEIRAVYKHKLDARSDKDVTAAQVFSLPGRWS
jgi:hypothetical protein